MNNDQVAPAETTEILHLAESCLSLPGDYVELGCYRGDTSVLLGKLLQKHTPTLPTTSLTSVSCGKPVQNLCRTPRNACKTPKQTCKTRLDLCKTSSKSMENSCKTLWIYDSFVGLPEKTPEDSSGAGANFQKGELLVSKREVVEKLRKHGLKISNHPDSTHSTVIIKKAWFNQLTPADLPPEIAFAFLDGDLYSSIQTSLQLVLPRLIRQGIIIVHDYNNPELPGSARAVDEFLCAHPDWKITQKHTLAIITRKC